MIKEFFIGLLVIQISSVFGQDKKIDPNRIQTGIGTIENEAIIKFNYQTYSKGARSTYNITYFGSAISEQGNENLEFWGHGNDILSILGPVQFHLDNDRILQFKEIMINHYKDFKENILSKKQYFTQSDILLFDDFEIIFSCYMNFRSDEYAFWVNRKKYIIEKETLERILVLSESYFKK